MKLSAVSIVLMIALAIGIALPQSGYCQNKPKPASKPAGTRPSGQAIIEELSLQDVEVLVVLLDGSEVPGFVRDANFFEEYIVEKKRYQVTTQNFAIQTFDAGGEPGKSAISAGKPLTPNLWSTVSAMNMLKTVPGLVVRVFFPEFLSGHVTIEYEKIDYIEIYGYVTAERIHQVAENVEKQIATSKGLAKEARTRLDAYFKEQRETRQNAEATAAIKAQVNALDTDTAARKALLQRFPPDKGWGKERWESIGKEYISTIGYVDTEEDYFYKHFEDWTLAMEEAASEALPDNQHLVKMFPPKDGWSAEKKAQLWQDALDGKKLSASEAMFVDGFDKWTEGVAAMVKACNAWKDKYPPAQWSRERVAQIQAKQQARETVSGQEQSFLQDVDAWEAALKWLDENLNIKSEK